MERAVKPTSDFFVRYLFGSPGHEDILLNFINTVLMDSDLRQAVELEIRNPFNLKTYDADKKSVLDVKAVDEQGRIFNVEIQVIPRRSYIKRTLFYWARNYQVQLGEGEDYSKLRPVICINILENELFGDLQKAHSCFLPMEKDCNEFCLTDDFQIHFLELSKIHEDVAERIKSGLSRWAYYLKNEGFPEKEDDMKILIKDEPVFDKAHDAYKHFTADNVMMTKYEARLKQTRDELSNLASAREDGLKQGIHQGELQKALSVAAKLKELNTDIDSIIQITGLSREQIEEL